MQEPELQVLVGKILDQRAESQSIELKAAAKGCPSRLFDSLSAFSNQDGGGIIIFGIDESNGFSVSGVYDAQDLQKKVTEQCKQMEPPVRALFTICDYNGKTVVSAEIPGVEPAQRPVFYKGVGRIKGSFIRMGDSDEPMTEYEVYSYDAFRRRVHDDRRTVEDASPVLFDEGALDAYIGKVTSERRNLAESVSRDELLELMGITRNGVPTIAGTAVFSKYPQGYFPQLCITAVVVPGTQKGELGASGERFTDNKRITGTIPQMVEDAVGFVRKNCRVKTIIDERGRRADREEYPLRAVREAVLNALVHRDYSIHTENTPVSIEMYTDRLEITNPGGLYGNLPTSVLGRSRPETRNAVLANILEVLGVTENRYSGIPTMRMECKAARLPEPEFAAVHGEFKTTFRNDLPVLVVADPAPVSLWPAAEMPPLELHSPVLDRADMRSSLLAFCEKPRSRAELVAFTGMSHFYTMSKLVQPLVESGALRLTLPEKPKSSAQRYVRSKA